METTLYHERFMPKACFGIALKDLSTVSHASPLGYNKNLLDVLRQLLVDEYD